MKHDEYQLQKNVFTWADLQSATIPELKLLNASLNGVRLTIGQAVKAKNMGMKRGFPDLFLPVARGQAHGLFIELKVGKNKLSDDQKKWKLLLEDQGYVFQVCRTLQEVVDIIKWYLEEQND